jgi:hypothetical protein
MQITKVTCTDLREITFREYERVIDGWMLCEDVWIRNSDGCRTPGLGFAGGGSVGVLTLTLCFHPVQAWLIVNLQGVRVCAGAKLNEGSD